MNNQLKQFIATYEACNAFQTKNQKETLMSHEIPNRPWSKVGSDIFEWKREHCLVLVDYYSNWIEFDLMRNQTPAEIINLMQKQFARWGIPEDIVTDNGITTPLNPHSSVNETTSNTPNLHLITARVMETLNLL